MPLTSSDPAADPNNYFFGEAHSINKLADNLDEDPTIKNVLSGISSGDGTKGYFNMVDSFAHVLGSVGKTGDLSGWNQASMEDGTTAYYQKTTDGKNDYTVTIQSKDFNVDDKGKIKPNDTKVVIDGQTFNGIGFVAANMLINGTIITETLWVIGTCAAGDVAWPPKWPSRWESLSREPGGGLVIEKWAAAEEEAAGNAIRSKSGLRAFLKRIGRPGPIAILIIIAALTIILSLVLRESYHRVRLWNLTRYKLIWDNTDNFYFYEGKIQDGPFVDGKPSSFGSVCASSPFSGAKKVKQAHFGDFNIVSDSMVHGIGWAMRIKLVNPRNNDDVKYACSLMFDIPFTGNKSTSVTFDAISNLKDWYGSQEGVNRSVHQEAKSPDGEITASTSYDYLSGKHAVPSSSGATTEAYFYQSVISFIEKDITKKDLAECPPPQCLKAPKPCNR